MEEFVPRIGHAARKNKDSRVDYHTPGAVQETVSSRRKFVSKEHVGDQKGREIAHVLPMGRWKAIAIPEAT